ncbi:conserved hypothetical protein [Candidatus Methylacidithermus pantelleriae]|uniref:FIST N domain protein n=1 Tax=Candidatus Methylacidithermus pantelleriae TaxID=2744239 RepID=A0A8J2FRW5_9BACT|nr:conserved hypothetical protein [Candidatus Methylacidithermus pantelleriae]
MDLTVGKLERVIPQKEGQHLRVGLVTGFEPEELLQSLHATNLLPLSVGILFASGPYDHPKLFEELVERLPCPIWGFSAAGLLHSGSDDFQVRGLALLGIQSFGDVFSASTVLGFPKGSEEAGRLARRAFEGCRFGPELLYLALAARPPAETVKFSPFTLLVGHSDVGSEEENLMGISQELGRSVRIVGGTAGDTLFLERVSERYCYGEGRAEKGALSLLGIATTLKNGVGMANAFRPVKGKGAFVTESLGRQVKTLDHKPAADVYAELVGAQSWEEAQAYFKSHPLGIVEVTTGYWQVRSPAAIGADGSLFFFSHVPQGSGLTLLETDREARIQSVRAAVRRALADAGFPKRIAAVIAFNCVLCHQQALSLACTREELRAIQQEVGWDVPILGASTYGETGTTVSGTVGHHNQTITLWVLADEACTE